MINALWIGFFLTAIAVAAAQTLWQGRLDLFGAVMQAGFANARLGFEIALGLTGVMSLWLGLMRVGEAAGLMQAIARGLAPLVARIFPAVPRGHPAVGAMTLNVSANMLGLDNAATPMGLQAMRELQTLNPSRDTASDAQILFLVINAASVTLLPVTVFTYRTQLGAANPTDVFIPILLATYASTLAGFLAIAAIQRLPLFNPVVLGWLAGLTALVGGAAAWFAGLPADKVALYSSLIGNGLLLGVIAVFLLAAIRARINAFEAFIDGAKDGFRTAVGIIPYLVAMLVAIGMLRASGALEAFVSVLRSLLDGFDTRWLDALPTMLMKSLSGSGARAMMIETMREFGADSYAGRLASIVQGSSETTFYVLAVYLGAAGLKKARYALAVCLFSDLVSLVAAVLACTLFFG